MGWDNSRVPLSLVRIGDGRILHCRLGGNGHHDDSNASGRKNPTQFAHCLHIIVYMFKHMAAVDYVETVVRILNIGDIHLHHRMIGTNIARDIFDIWHLPVPRLEY